MHMPRATTGAGEADYKNNSLGFYDGTFCASPRCRAIRRMELRAVYNAEAVVLQQREAASKSRERMAELSEHLAEQTVLWFATKGLALFRAVCLQCRRQLDLVLYSHTEDQVLALGVGGMATPGTPRAVAYYLDQAERARSQSAYSAAAVMYRSALEQLLYETGFSDRTLAQRIEAVERSAPEWLRSLDVAFMTALRRLGNRAVHSGSANADALATADHQTVVDMRAVFPGLLHAIYEEPRLRAEHLERLRGRGDDAAASPEAP